MALTMAAIQSAKTSSRPLKLFDGEGLFLLVTPSGSKWWRFKYRFAGKEKLLSLGTFPAVSLKDARMRRNEVRRLLYNGKDPGLERKLGKVRTFEGGANAFEAIACEWLAKFSVNWSESHTLKTTRLLEKNIFPWFRGRQIGEIRPQELLTSLQRIEKRGALETAHRTMQACGQIFRYAVATGRAERDITADLRGALPPAPRTHLASIKDPKEVGKLLRAIEGYEGDFKTCSALKLAPLVFVRPGELRKAEWKEFNLKGAEWRIAAERTKMKEQHIVPLSTQAVCILKDIFALTGQERYVFPGTRPNGRPMSENTINAALRQLGYKKDQMTGHGFRSMASTLLNENGWNRDAIERQLAHGERNKVRAAYNFAEFLPERRKMMQWWADYLEKLATKK